MSNLWLLLRRWIIQGRCLDIPVRFYTTNSSSTPTLDVQTRAETDSTFQGPGNPEPSYAASNSDYETWPTPTAVSNASVPTESVAVSPTSSIAVTDYPTLTSTSAIATSTTNTASTEAGALSISTDSTKTKLAIALPIAIIGLLVVIGLIFFYYRQRRQRNAPPAYDVATNQSKAVSTSELVAVPKFVAAERTNRFPALDVPNNHIRDSSPGSSTVRSPDDANTELGLAVAVPKHKQMSATRHDLHGMPRSPPANENRRSAVRSPYQNRSEADALSVVSDLNERRGREEDFDDMSSVSSFNDDNPRDDHNTHSFR